MMQAPALPPSPDLFGDPSAVIVERAVAELRAGRPVRLREAEDRQLVVLALDNASPHSHAAFAALAGDAMALLITGTRATTLGLPPRDSMRLPAAHLPLAGLIRLAWHRPSVPDTAPPPLPSHSPALDAAAIELSRLSLLLPALLVVDIPDGSTDWDQAFVLSSALLSTARATGGRSYEIVARTVVPLRDVGPSEFVVFRGGIAQRDQVAILVGNPSLHSSVPVRVHSSCLTGDLFGSLKCDCGDQLRHGLIALQAKGGGVLLYLDQEGRGTGIAAKMRAYGFQNDGLDTIDADAQLGHAPDGRRYEAAVAMLAALGIERIELLSNNPTKAARLSAGGITVTGCSPVTGEVTDENEHYLRTKASRAGHLLDVDALIAAAQR